MQAARGARALIALLTLAAPLAALDAPPAARTLDQQYVADVRPLLATYCFRCHGGSQHKGGVRLDALDHQLSEKNVPTWTDARNVLDVGTMPPEDAPQPARDERERLLAWVSGSIKRFESDHLETLGDVLLRRINLRAYRNMVGTLTGVRPDLSEFQQDGTLQHFDTVGSALYLTQDAFMEFFACAQRAIEDARAAGSAGTKTVSLDRDFRRSRMDQNRGDIPQLEQFIAAHGNPSGFASIRDQANITPAQTALISVAIEPAISAFYGKKQFAEVEKASIDWRHDPKCMAAVLDRARETTARYQKHIEDVCAFQPLTYASPDINISGDFKFDDVQVDIPGDYLISATLCTFKAGCPLPMKFVADGRTVATFLVEAPPGAPRAYAATIHLARGKHDVLLSSTLPLGKEGPMEMAYIQGFMHAHYGVAAPMSFRNGGTFIDQADLGPGDLHGYGWRKRGEAILTVSEFHLHGPLTPFAAQSGEPTALAEALAGNSAGEPTRENAERRILAFMRRAYAGTGDAECAKPVVDMVMEQFARSRDFTGALCYGLATVMCSPRFLYLEEAQRADPAKRRPLDGRELARRLAYFLWSDLPDAELMAAAASGALLEPRTLAAQARRLIQDPRSAAFREAFTYQWLRIDQLNTINIPYEFFPDYDTSLLESARQESVAFFSEILDHDLSVMNFADSDFVVIDNRLAMHYGIPGVSGSDFRRVQLPPGSHRGGVLGQAAVLIATSNGMTSNLVHRGVFIMEQLLGIPAGVPPPNVPALSKVAERAADGQLLAQSLRLSQHRSIASCARCHDKIDPLGIGLEQFDALGVWREQLRMPVTISSGKHLWCEQPADVRGRLPDGEAYDGPDALRACIARQPMRFMRRLAENLLIYALGRDLQQSDGPALDAICAQAARSGSGLATLIEGIVLSEQFRDK